MKKLIGLFSALFLLGLSSVSHASDITEMQKEIQELKSLLKNEIGKRKALESKVNHIEGRSEELSNVDEKSSPILDIRNENNPLSFSGGVTGVVQGTNGNFSRVNGTTDRSAFAFTFDLSVNARLAENHRFFVNLEGGQGDNINDIVGGVGAVSSPNYDPYNTTAGSLTNVTISGAYWVGTFFDEKLTVTAGKLDSNGFFDENAYANDETAQFLTAMFVRSYGSIFQEVNNYYSPGIGVQLALNDYIELSGVVAANSFGDLMNNLMSVAQINFKPHLFGHDGNYRVYISQDNRSGQINIANGRSTEHTGIGVSADQELLNGVGVFGRYARAEKGVNTGGTNVEILWMAGIDFNGLLWGRDGDNVGIAYGTLNFNNKLAGNQKNEKHFEVYYNYEVFPQIHLTPNYQYINYVTADGGATYRNVSVFGMRGQFDF
ncbi:MAG: carbohydrate porin [Nitrospinae bacterium]|nr:carbohydrate porin [Nitrospinota bacterium]